GVPAIDLPFPRTLDEVIAAIRQVGAALGRAPQGEALVAEIEELRRSASPADQDTIWIGGGGRTVPSEGLEAQWMALAGLRQRALNGDQVQLEELLVRPPRILLRSDYRQRQYSRAQAWLTHPLARAAGNSRTLPTDGRRWTCMGPLMSDEIRRLRRERAA
ncbi:MAG TPA: hypothetical protein VGB54_09565, partial [Allosphingosinicella sp.]